MLKNSTVRATPAALTLVVTLLAAPLNAQSGTPDSTRAPARVDVKMLPSDPPAADTVYDPVYLKRVEARSHLWYVNSFMRHAFVVELLDVRDERSCRARLVEFTAAQGAVASAALTAPSAKVAGDWVREKDTARVYCRASIRWRLGDVPGRQTLNARLVRNEKHFVPDAVIRTQLDSGVVEWEASAHALPSLVAGFSYNVAANPAPRVEGDSLLGRRGQPFFGVEFAPLAVSGNRGLARVSERVRVTLGTSYRSPGRDFYVGVNPLVAFDGLRTTVFPVQLTAGSRRFDGRWSYFVGGTANASALFSNFLAAVLPSAS
jgi:hypothetical protein